MGGINLSQMGGDSCAARKVWCLAAADQELNVHDLDLPLNYLRVCCMYWPRLRNALSEHAELWEAFLSQASTLSVTLMTRILYCNRLLMHWLQQRSMEVSDACPLISLAAKEVKKHVGSRVWKAGLLRPLNLEAGIIVDMPVPDVSDSGSPEATRSTRRTAKKTMSITAEKVTLTHPTPPHPSQSKPDPSSVRVFASEHERYFITLPHPTPPHPTKARPQLSACVCKRNWTLLPHPTQPKPDPSSVRVFASETECFYPTPPNQSPTPAQCVCLQAKLNVIPPNPCPLSHPCNIKWCVFMVVLGWLMKTRVCVCDPTFACVCDSKTRVCVTQLSPVWMTLTPLTMESYHF